MPPKVSYTEQEIILASLDVIRDQGTEGLTARAVAKEMGGSTQPIYRVFGNIEDLENAAIKEAQKIMIKHMIDYNYNDRPFLSIGLGFLEFARKEPRLYHLLFLSGKKLFDFDHNTEPFKSIFEKMRNDKDLKDLPEEVLIKIYTDMSIYSHGLCSIGLMKPGGFTIEEYLPQLEDMGMRLIIFEILSMNGAINESIKKRSINHEDNNS